MGKQGPLNPMPTVAVQNNAVSVVEPNQGRRRPNKGVPLAGMRGPAGAVQGVRVCELLIGRLVSVRERTKDAQ